MTYLCLERSERNGEKHESMKNVVMAKAFVPEARVCVIEKACACVTPQTHQTAIAAMGPIQADVI